MEEGGTIDIEVENQGLPALPAAVEVALFRIAVEGVTNVVRHAEAAPCRVRLGAAGASAYVEVVDDGASDWPGRPASASSRCGNGCPSWAGLSRSAPPPRAAASLRRSRCPQLQAEVSV